MNILCVLVLKWIKWGNNVTCLHGYQLQLYNKRYCKQVRFNILSINVQSILKLRPVTYCNEIIEKNVNNLEYMYKVFLKL